MSVAVKFLGGARTVTGSMHLIQTPQSNVLLDCGLFHGHRDEYYAVNSNFDFNPQDLDTCVISHAHIDHCGNIPTLIKKGYRSKIFVTSATKSLCQYMLPDSGYVQEEDIKYVNKINRRKGLPARGPLYTQKEAENALRYFRSLQYHEKFAISKDMDLTFYEAGHILGSATPVFDIKTTKGPTMRIAYAVDLGRKGAPLIKDPEIPQDIDYLIIESTYGGRKHSSLEEAEQVLADAINRTVKRGGKIIIPSFALERTQMMIFFIGELIKNKRIKRLPIYVDSPLAVNLTDVFRKNWEYFNGEIKQAFIENHDPFAHENVTYVRNVNRSKKLHNETGPMIIISASGMCENGRILHHLKNNIENPKNTVIVVGYMAQDTLGKRIVNKMPQVKIFGQLYELNAEVVVINAFSSHADSNGLVEYVKGCRGRLKKIFIVHGDEDQSNILRENLKKLNLNPHVPAKNEIVYLKA